MVQLLTFIILNKIWSYSGMSNYKDLNIDRETLNMNIEKYIESNGYVMDKEIQTFHDRKRIQFGAIGEEFATVDLLLNNKGTTTIHWKMGKNRPLGEKLAIYLKNTINPAEFEAVNYSLNGFTTETFNLILEMLQEDNDLGINIIKDELNLKQVKLISLQHSDSLTLTHHSKTRVLQIQGRPLVCYRRIIYLLTEFLDLKGLEQVLYRKDDSSAVIVRKEMAEEYLKGCFPKSYTLLPDSVIRLLISSCCVKLAAPTLPDYCLLLYPDLRSLEGALKEKMSKYGMSLGGTQNGFGDFFDSKNSASTLKPEYSKIVNHTKMVDALNTGYSFYRKHRHTLFHMEEFPNGSRMIHTLEIAISLSKDTYEKIDNLYTAIL